MTVKRYGTGLNGRIEEMECGAFTGYAEYSALLKERDALAVDSIQLRQFFVYCIESAFDGCNLDGGDIQDKALELGLVREEAYQSEKHGSLVSDSGYFEDGDSIYIVNEQTNVDAAIANIQAQGLEKYACSLELSADDAERDGYDDAVKFLRSEASGIRLFAAQLRKEPAHD
jgi:hypothetical protein